MIQSSFRAIACLLLTSTVLTANAAVRYSYTGNNYDSISGTAFDTNMQVSGYFTVDQPLSPGLSGALIVPAEYSFSNGVGVVDNTENPARADFTISTGVDGAITGWSIELLERFPEELAIGDVRHRITAEPIFDYAAIEEVVGQSGTGTWLVSPVDEVYSPIFQPGEWAAVLIPEIDVILDKQSENTIDLKRDKSIKVAIPGTPSFDALQVDPGSVKFGPTGTETSPVRARGNDINRDGYADLVLTFKTRDTGITCGDTRVLLTGILYSGPIPVIEAESAIVTVCR